jgi:hypothetical protein
MGRVERVSMPLNLLFSAFDKDGNGLVDLPELVRGLQGFHLQGDARARCKEGRGRLTGRGNALGVDCFPVHYLQVT